MSQQLRKDSEGEENLPFIRLFKTPAVAKVLDLVFERYDDRFTKSEISEIGGISLGDTETILRELADEGILKKEKDGSDVFYKGNFSSARAEGLFQYVRATLDENFDSNLKSV